MSRPPMGLYLRMEQSTPEQDEAQRRSFVHGNCSIENPDVTRQIVDEEAEKLASARDLEDQLRAERDADAPDEEGYPFDEEIEERWR